MTQKTTRRRFMQQVAAGASLALGGCASTSRTSMGSATDRVQLGDCGVTVPKLAMGTGTRGWEKVSDQTKLGKEKFSRLMEHGVDRGAAFIDAADLYGSHEYVRYALKNIPRDKVTLLSKIWFGQAPKMTPTTTAKPEVERFCKELGVDTIDIVLIHCTQDDNWPEQLKRMRDELSELKQRGLVRAVGCSCHTQKALERAAKHPWTDVVLGRINYDHQRMDQDATTDQVAQTLQLARANGKGVLGMKIYGCGNLLEPEQRRRSLEYVVGNNLVDAMTIGYTEPLHIDDTIENVNAVLRARA